MEAAYIWLWLVITVCIAFSMVSLVHRFFHGMIAGCLSVVLNFGYTTETGTTLWVFIFGGLLFLSAQFGLCAQMPKQTPFIRTHRSYFDSLRCTWHTWLKRHIRRHTHAHTHAYTPSSFVCPYASLASCFPSVRQLNHFHVATHSASSLLSQLKCYYLSSYVLFILHRVTYGWLSSCMRPTSFRLSFAGGISNVACEMLLFSLPIFISFFGGEQKKTAPRSVCVRVNPHYSSASSAVVVAVGSLISWRYFSLYVIVLFVPVAMWLLLLIASDT